MRLLGNVLAGKNIKFGVMAPAATWVAVGLPREGSGLTGADVIVLKEDKVSLVPCCNILCIRSPM